MKTLDAKTIISLCPFQTQLVVQIPVSVTQLAKGVTPQPQILKVPCDREKCQLWCAASAVCSVSVLPAIPVAICDMSNDQIDAIRDMVEELKNIKEHIKSWLPTP